MKIRGNRVELGEIESALTRHEKVREAAVALRRNVSGESSLVAYVVLKHVKATDETSGARLSEVSSVQ